MHDLGCTNDVAPKCFADCLMPQAHTQNRRCFGKVADQAYADAGFVGSTRTGRNDDLLGMHVVNLLDRDLVVAAYFDVGAQLSDVLDQVIGKRIVIVENENKSLTSGQACSLHQRTIRESTSGTMGWRYRSTPSPRKGQSITRPWY